MVSNIVKEDRDLTQELSGKDNEYFNPSRVKYALIWFKLNKTSVQR
jgi:hypothetical protein